MLEAGTVQSQSNVRKISRIPGSPFFFSQSFSPFFQETRRRRGVAGVCQALVFVSEVKGNEKEEKKKVSFPPSQMKKKTCKRCYEGNA
jgi:hypothetical protein